ncbi:MAG: DUF4349 domain-containing protein [Bacteroidota bacterium]
MKRILLIILAVVGVVFVIGLAFAGMATRQSLANRSLSSPSFGMGGGGAPVTQAPAAVEAPMPAMEPGAAPALDAAGNAVKSIDSYATAGQAAQERIVIQTADLAIVVTDPQTRMTEISKMANDMGGYVVSSSLYQSYAPSGKQVPEATIMIRVPAGKLDAALAEIKKGAGDVQHENRSGQDVTNAYVDLQAQLKAKQAAEEQLLKIMDQAVKAEDVLNTYMQVQTIQTEIEQLKGQIKYYDEAVALSSINVQLIAEESTQPIEVGPWKPAGAAKQAVQDLIYFIQNFVDFLIRFVIYILPALLLIALPLLVLFLIGRAIYRRTRKPKASVEETEIGKK